MTPNIASINELINTRFDGNKAAFAKAIGVSRAQVSMLIHEGKGAGAAFLGGLIAYCEQEGLDFKDYIFLPNSVNKLTEQRRASVYCIECGSKAPDNAKFCSECGRKLPGTAQEDKPPKIYTVQTALRDYFQGCISESKLRQAIREGTIPHARIGSRILIRETALDTWMEEQEKRAVSAMR